MVERPAGWKFSAAMELKPVLVKKDTPRKERPRKAGVESIFPVGKQRNYAAACHPTSIAVGDPGGTV